MKRKNVTLAISALFLFLGTTTIKAQDAETTATEKRTFGKWLTETPWTVGFGANIIQDGGPLFKSSLFGYAYFPATFTADKNLSWKGFSTQLAFTSTSLKPHSFLSVDLNLKYDLNNLIGDTKWFDPYAISGVGIAYRDQTTYNKAYEKNTRPTFAFGFGANFWLTQIMAINLQGQAKFTKDNFLVAHAGLVFKLNNAAPACEATAKTPEAEDALQHLRGIINK